MPFTCSKLIFINSTALLWLWLVVIAPAALASETELVTEDVRSYQTKLDKLYKSIEKVKQHLKSTRHKRTNVVTELQKLETRISSNSQKLKKTSAEVRKLDERIRKLKKELKQLDSRVLQQQQLLAEQLRSAYVSGGSDQIKMLLNQEDPEMLGRLQVYFDYLNRSRQQHIREFNLAITRKQEKQEELHQALQSQNSKLALQKKQKRQLGQQRRQRASLLARLDSEIKDQELTLSDLRTSRDRIENLLMSLGELLADIPPGPADRAAFQTLMGSLPWPVDGPFAARYGTQKNQGDLRWNGVLISSDYGSPVKAVSHGRVVFSDWLQGFGFISIVDHGQGYMTLYGHNESLFKQPGDWVEAGEIIATVGDSGGHTAPALYFEIRERGKPVNPARWCSSRSASAS